MSEATPEQLFRMAVEVAPNGMIAVDESGKILLVNQETEGMFGYSRDELVGRPIECLLPDEFRKAHPRHRAVYGRNPETRAMGHGRDLRGRRKDGTEIPVEIGLNPMRGMGRGLVLAVIVDISERKLNEEMLHRSIADLAAQKAVIERQANELRRANEELEEFAYAASHDLREPLRNLISYAELLREDLPEDLPAEAEQDLEFITDSATRMNRLVGDLLNLSRTGRGEIQKEIVSLEDCVRESLETLQKNLDEQQGSCEKDPLPDVSGDRRLLTQLYQNLLANAMKFHRPGIPPRIHLTAEKDETEWLFGVRDNGIGIAPEHATEVFAPFKRLHGMGEFDGTGVGLAICRKAVERHGGRIWVESEPGQGAHFRFTLPVTKV